MRQLAHELIDANDDRSMLWFRPATFQSALERLVARFALTTAQVRVLVPMVLAYEDPEIAELLFVSSETVRSHTKAILHAAGLPNRKVLIREFFTELAEMQARSSPSPFDTV